MFKLAHISDIHLSPLPVVRRRELLSKRITGYINWQRNRAREHRPEILRNLIEHLTHAASDHIAVTGDLVNLALPLELFNANRFLESLGNGQDVSVVCGNHDAYISSALEQALKLWQPYLQGDNGIQVKSDEDYPVVRIRKKIAIIGCNTARATPPFHATGFFENDQAARLTQILREQEAAENCRVILIHHPPFANATKHHKRLIGDARFRSVIAEQGAELVLHGHTHLDTIEWIDGAHGPVPVIGVPAAGQAPGAKRPPARYNLFEINGNNTRWNIILKQFGYSNTPLVEGVIPQVELLGERQLKPTI